MLSGSCQQEQPLATRPVTYPVSAHGVDGVHGRSGGAGTDAGAAGTRHGTMQQVSMTDVPL